MDNKILTDNVFENFWNKMKALREERGFTQEDLAEKSEP